MFLARRGAFSLLSALAIMQREFAATGNELLLHRPVIASLLDMAQTLRKPQISLQGWTGSGKSAAMYSLVAWARANGWIALYVPSAFSMVQGVCWS